MSSLRGPRTVFPGGQPILLVAYRRQMHRTAGVHQIRFASSKGKGKKDDLGGPGGQEPVDPTARAKQNASLRNKTIAAMVLIGGPIFYMVSKLDQVAGAKSNQNNDEGNKDPITPL